MKKIKTSICVWLALSAVFMTGCYNDEDLWNKISGLENRIETLETWQTKMTISRMSLLWF